MATCSEIHVDDSVEYCLFPDIDIASKEDVDGELNEALNSYMVELSPQLVDYIWQNEQFNLQMHQAQQEVNVPVHLQGSMQFGDNVEDEWFIVYLLLKLTKDHQGLIAKISDNDGEFLLIEGAYHLPKWLNPETSKNRVFLFDGELHIVPLPATPAEVTWLPAGTPSIQHALNTIRSHPDRTLASEPLRDAIHKRLQGYPQKAQEQMQCTRCYLPARAATVLQHSPGLVAAAVQAFCHKDPIDMKTCRFMKFFPPEDLIMSQVKFTRCLYAQVTQQRFQPPVRSGWKIPSSSNPKHKSCDLGMKLAYGLEILCSRCRCPPEELAAGTNAVWNSSRWQRYMNSLKQKGFFRGEIEGSTLYTKLLRSAKVFYLETTNEGSSNISDPGYKVLEILNSNPSNIKHLVEMEKNQPADDDEDWLTLTADELDKLIETASGKPLINPTLPSYESDQCAVDFSTGLLTSTMKSFVDKVSSFEGAEFPNDTERAPINFDAESFEKAIENLLDFRPAVDTNQDSDELLSSGDDIDDDDEDDDDDDKDDENIDFTDLKAKGDDVREIQQLMQEMDHELATTTIGESFEKEPQIANDDNIEVIEEAKDELRPVEVDLNLLKNLLESYSSQNGLAGPASNILHSMGLKLPDNSDKT